MLVSVLLHCALPPLSKPSIYALAPRNYLKTLFQQISSLIPILPLSSISFPLSSRSFLENNISVVLKIHFIKPDLTFSSIIWLFLAKLCEHCLQCTQSLSPHPILS